MTHSRPSESRHEPSGTYDLRATGTPRWVKVFAIVALVAVVAFVVLLLTGRGGEHGPGRHGADTRLQGVAGDRGTAATSAYAPAVQQ